MNHITEEERQYLCSRSRLHAVWEERTIENAMKRELTERERIVEETKRLEAENDQLRQQLRALGVEPITQD